MNHALITSSLWLIPALPLVASAASALLSRSQKRAAAALAITSMAISLLLSLAAFAAALGQWHIGGARKIFNFEWFELAATGVRLGWVLDPLSATMLVMVTVVGLMIFIYSLDYMAHDENFTRFFCFLSLFAGSMLGLVIANSLLLLFICWELVGLASYLLIGFWFDRPSAAAAAKKAFITTRVGDLAFFLGMLWLFSETRTLLFYDAGNGCLEPSALTGLAGRTTAWGLAVSTAIGLLVFLGAMGKSGQVPLHVWLPDAMEGPTPVSALIHAATMVAAGVFLIARLFPLVALPFGEGTGPSTTLQAITWVGAVTAVFGALVAVAQNDIKRILAYSTVSQLGYMMMGLGAGGVAVGMFHLVTHAFFKALLFMGAGSAIHGCCGEQDIRRMGGLRKYMPVTFAVYGAGMLALSGFPLLFSGFWSKDAILHVTHGWSVSHWPFYLGLTGAFLTAFYMTRQVCYVFLGAYRGPRRRNDENHRIQSFHPHESPRIMLWPMVVLAVFAVGLGFLGTPAWPWFEAFMEGRKVAWRISAIFNTDVLALMLTSTLLVFAGLFFGFRLYGRRPPARAETPDPLQLIRPDIHRLLQKKLYVDELYDFTAVHLHSRFSVWCAELERVFFEFGLILLSYLGLGLAWFSRLFDEYILNSGFDRTCRALGQGGAGLSRFQNGRVQRYLRVLAGATVVLILLLLLGCRYS